MENPLFAIPESKAPLCERCGLHPSEEHGRPGPPSYRPDAEGGLLSTWQTACLCTKCWDRLWSAYERRQHDPKVRDRLERLRAWRVGELIGFREPRKQLALPGADTQMEG